MSRCGLRFGRSIDCYTNVAGIKAIYIVPFDELPFDKVFIDEDELINIGGLTPNAYKYEIQSSSNTFDESNNIDSTTGNISWDGSLTVSLVKQNNLYQAELKKLPNLRSKVIVEFNGGYFRLMGVENGCDFTVSSASGGPMNDFNGYNVEISSKEQYMSPFIYVTLESLGFDVVITEPVPYDPTSFITQWKTNSASESITLPYYLSGIYDGTIDWGDGTSSDNTFANRTHVYDAAGDYIITITGKLEGFRFDGGGDCTKITQVLQWGNVILPYDDVLDRDSYFEGCINLDCSLVSDILINVPDSLTNMFRGCTSLQSIRFLSYWDTVDVVNMEFMFSDCPYFNQNINDWDTSSVTTLRGIFQNAGSFNQPLDNWNTSSVTILQDIFNGAVNFNHSLNNWDVSNVVDFRQTFRNSGYNQPLNDWVLNSSPFVMDSMFRGAISFNQPLFSWDTSSCASMNKMFYQAYSFNQNISMWDFNGLTGPTCLEEFMYDKGNYGYVYDCEYYSDLLITWSTSTIPDNQVNVDMGNIQYETSVQGARDILTNTRNWALSDGGDCDVDSFIMEITTTSNFTVFELPWVFSGSYSGTIDWGDYFPHDVNSYANRVHTYELPGTYQIRVTGYIYGISFNRRADTIYVTDIMNWGSNTHIGDYRDAFRGCANMDITAKDSPKSIFTMESMFYGCTSLVNVNGSLTFWDVSNVVNFSNAFKNCTSFNKELDFWDTSNGTNFTSMFHSATSFNQDISSWDTSKAKSMSLMFCYALAFDQDISAWDYSSLVDISGFMRFKMFSDYSTTNYDALIIKWNSNGPNNMYGVDMGTIKRTATSSSAYTNLTTIKGWSISDGGIL